MRTIASIALDIKKAWKSPAAVYAMPYLDAMRTMHHRNPNEHYMFDTADDIIRRFLCNATSFRGAAARSLKAELKEIINLK